MRKKPFHLQQPGRTGPHGTPDAMPFCDACWLEGRGERGWGRGAAKGFIRPQEAEVVACCCAVMMHSGVCVVGGGPFITACPPTPAQSLGMPAPFPPVTVGFADADLRRAWTLWWVRAHVAIEACSACWGSRDENGAGGRCSSRCLPARWLGTSFPCLSLSFFLREMGSSLR